MKKRVFIAILGFLAATTGLLAQEFEMPQLSGENFEKPTVEVGG